MFKHPTPEDFFRTMEDASAFDLDWFWRGWFYTTDWVDIGVKEVNQYVVSSQPNDYGKRIVQRYKISSDDLVYLVEVGSEASSGALQHMKPSEASKSLKEYLMDNFTTEERLKIKEPKYFYNVTFNKPGGLVMPVIVEYAYADGTKKRETYPAEIWRLNDNEVSKAIASDKEIVSMVVDPDLETADIDTSNNHWPKQNEKSDFEKFKDRVRG